MSRRLLRLKEFEVAVGVELTETDVNTLRRVVPSVRITPTIEHPGCYDLVPGSVIGAITSDTFDVVISPKIPIDRLLFLLSHPLDPKHWKPTNSTMPLKRPSLTPSSPVSWQPPSSPLWRGLLQGYVSVEDALMGVRGRIRFDEQLRRRQSVTLPVEARWDEFTEDIEENRLLKAATRILRTLRPRSEAYGVRLRRLEAQLEPLPEQLVLEGCIRQASGLRHWWRT